MLDFGFPVSTVIVSHRHGRSKSRLNNGWMSSPPVNSWNVRRRTIPKLIVSIYPLQHRHLLLDSRLGMFLLWIIQTKHRCLRRAFESVVDSHSQEITNYCVPGLLTLLTSTTSFVHEVRIFNWKFYFNRLAFSHWNISNNFWMLVVNIQIINKYLSMNHTLNVHLLHRWQFSSKFQKFLPKNRI